MGTRDLSQAVLSYHTIPTVYTTVEFGWSVHAGPVETQQEPHRKKSYEEMAVEHVMDSQM
jgi:hypothetical protein